MTTRVFAQPMTDLLDPEQFPFTQAELARAFGLAEPPRRARAHAASLARLARWTHEGRQQAAAARERGSRDPAEISQPTLDVAPEVLALLAALSPALEARVEALLEARRAASHPHRRRNAMWQAGHHPLAPATSAVLAALAAEDEQGRVQWVAVRAQVDAAVRRARGADPVT